MPFEMALLSYMAEGGSMEEITYAGVLEKAIHKWGYGPQLRMAMEECGELVAAIAQYERGRVTSAALIEEVADVLIMMHQLRLILGPEFVDEAYNKKIERLRKRLND